MRIVIAGLPKSGTTALYSALKQSLPSDYAYFFEVSNFKDDSPNVLAKILLDVSRPVQTEDFDAFEKKVFLIRDPRDILVSQLLYWIYDLPFYMDDGKVDLFLAALSQKQKAPAEVSVVELVNLLSQLSDIDLLSRFVQNQTLAERFNLERSAYFAFRYEDFLVGNLSGLENFVGFSVSFSGNVDQEFARVARSKRSGDWRDWFTPADTAYFQPIFQDFLNRHSYDLDWSPDALPVIKPEHSTDYVQRLVTEKRMFQRIYDLQQELQIKVAERDQIILDQQSTLASRDEGIASLRDALAERDQVTSFLQNTIADLENAQAQLNTEVMARDRRLADLQAELVSQVANRDQLIRDLQSELHTKVSERDQLIRALQTELHTKVTERDHLIEDLRRDSDRQQAAHTALAADLKSQAARLEAQKTNLEEQTLRLTEKIQSDAAQHQQALQAAARHMQAAESERVRQQEVSQQQLASLQQRNVNLNNELELIHTSRYWKTLGIYWRVVDRWLSFKKWLAASLRDLGYRWLTPAQLRTLVRAFKRPPPERAVAVLPVEAAAPEPSARVQTTVSPPASYDIYCFGIIDWDFRYQRPQQLLSRLARAGQRVYYVRPRFNSGDEGLSVRQLAERVWELTLPGAASLVPYTDDWPVALVDEAWQALVDFADSQGSVEAVTLVELPFWSPLVRRLQTERHWRLIYDCLDLHAGFTVTHAHIAALENDLLQASDLTLFTAETLREHYAERTRNHLLLRNAADYAHFAPARDPLWVPELAGLAGPVIGYYGAIAEWFDFELIRQAAHAHPDWQFVLIGHSFGADTHLDLIARPNVRLLGEKPYAELPGYLSRFDVALIPFKESPLTRATDPVKVYEYLAAGKSVVATDLPELSHYAGQVYLSRTPAEFIAQIEKALAENTPDRVAARQALARTQTWEQRCADLQAAIVALYPKVSLVIVTYHNLAFTQQCLESIWRNTDYPNYEVIVVDNASTDDTLAYLRAQLARPGFKLIANDRNRGFAAANNQGLAQASGDYLVLLNNDTVVPRGWLTRLAHHLAQPDLGLVGPVTNWTGNEARVAVTYDSLTEMESFAQSYMRSHRDQCFDIPVLAFYCVAFRRAVWQAVGPLDEQFEIGMFEDDDYAQRVRQLGLRVVCAEDVFIHHYGEAAFGELKRDNTYERVFAANRQRFENKWGQKWQPHQART